jgi:hypothetical protein
MRHQAEAFHAQVNRNRTVSIEIKKWTGFGSTTLGEDPSKELIAWYENLRSSPLHEHANSIAGAG